MFFFGSSLAALSSIQIEEVITTSTGKSIDEAVVSCLVEAIRQKRGVEIDALSEIYFSLENLFHREGVDEFSTETIKDEVIEEVFMHTKGLIEKYEILSQKIISDGIWEVKLKAFVPIYRKIETNKRSTLVLVPIKPLQGLKYTEGIDIEEIARLISRRLTTQLVQARHYNILDREYGSEFEKERQLIISGGFPFREMARLEEQLGADYLLIGTLSDVHSSITTQEWYGKNVTRCQVLLSIDVRAVEFATRQVHRAETVTASLDRIIDLSNTKDKATKIPGPIISELVDGIIDKLNSGFLDILMPIRVLDSRDNTVYLNQGGSRIRSGEKFSIMDTHRSIKDLGSGAVIRIEGEKLVEVVVREVLEEYSTADIISGDKNLIKAGLKCIRLP